MLKRKLTKTEIAALWIIFIGIIALVFLIVLFKNGIDDIGVFDYIYLILWAFSIVVAFFVLKNKKVFWYIEQLIIFIILVMTVSPVFECFKIVNSHWRAECFAQSWGILFVPILFILFPLILFLIDCKNFLK